MKWIASEIGDWWLAANEYGDRLTRVSVCMCYRCGTVQFAANRFVSDKRTDTISFSRTHTRTNKQQQSGIVIDRDQVSALCMYECENGLTIETTSI